MKLHTAEIAERIGVGIGLGKCSTLSKLEASTRVDSG